jgi:hypothetical protein
VWQFDLLKLKRLSKFRKGLILTGSAVHTHVDAESLKLKTAMQRFL